MPLLLSSVPSANSPDTPFPLNNLPCGVFSTPGTDPRCGTAIGDMILDLAAAEAAGLIGMDEPGRFDLPYWNDVMELGPAAWAGLRAQLQALLAEAAGTPALTACLIPQAQAEMHLPVAVSEFTDFYASRDHATNVGTMLRGADNALPPNWLHMPIGYNGRASSVVVGGTPVTRPNGQLKSDGPPTFGPSRRLDFELELGAILGTASHGPVTVAQADAMIFGYVLLNDWSARDIQAWEYQPLGPFQAKAFATSIGPWMVTAAALAPFRTSTPQREVALLPYLHEPGPMLFDIDLSVTLQPQGAPASTISRTNYNRMYYSAAQQLAHHASSGCPMNVGDLLGSGTVSGPGTAQRGSLFELAQGGRTPLTLETGQTRSFVEDGDTLTLAGAALGDGYRIGFGTCSGTVVPAPRFP